MSMKEHQPLISSSESSVLPQLRHQRDIEKAQQKSKRNIYKKYDFFILYQSKGLDGQQLPDALFAHTLQERLEKEKKLNGAKTTVTSVDASSTGIEDALEVMSISLVVLVIFSEMALKTFADDAHGFTQNNYLLLLQLATSLQDESGVRMVGLNLMSIDTHEEEPTYFRCEGWYVNFNDVPHYSEWIQMPIKQTMNKIFAIQGNHIDPLDWEYKIPELYTSLYTFQDEINASGWITVFFIIPWKAMAGMFFTFLYTFFLPCCGLCIACVAYRCSKGAKAHRVSRLNVARFASGLSMFFFGLLFLYLSVRASTPSRICESEIKCQVAVTSGNLWALWQYNGQSCGCGDTWDSYFEPDCVECVCRWVLDSKSFSSEEIGECTSSQTAYIVFMAVCWVAGAITISVAVVKLSRQAQIFEKAERKAEGGQTTPNEIDAKGKGRTTSASVDV